MTTDVLKMILDGQKINYGDENYDQLFHIQSLNFNSHGNFFVDPLGTWVRFDIENELIRIKEYYYKVISSRFSERYNTSKNQLITGLKPANFHSKYPFRRPQVGDFIFFVSKKDNIRHSITAEIRSIHALNGNVIFTCDNDLPENISLTHYACYADGAHFDVIQSDTDLVTEYENDATLLFWHKPKTSFTTDQYFDINNLVSINVY